MFCSWVNETTLSLFLWSLLRKTGRSLRWPFRERYSIKKQTGDWMIRQLLNWVIAKYRDFSVSRRSIICLSCRLRPNYNWSARHWQIMIFCSTSSNNCQLLLWLVLFCCLFVAFFSTKWNLDCECHVYTGASCSGMFLTFRSDRAEGNTYGESNQGWCLNKRRKRLSAPHPWGSVQSSVIGGTSYLT